MTNAGYEVTTWDESELLRTNLQSASSNHEQIFREWFQNINNIEDIVAVVLDINLNLKDFDGLDVLRIIRRDALHVIDNNADYNKMPIIVLTSNKEKDDEAHKISYESPDRFVVKEETNEKSFSNKLNFEIRRYNLNITSEKIYNIVHDTNNKVTELGLLSKMIAKTLPKLTDKNKANKIIKEWKEDTEFQEIMAECFPEKHNGLFTKLEKLIDKFKDDAVENLSEALYEQAIVYFETEADIDEDDTKMIQYLKYSTYIVEKIGQAVK